MILPFNFLGHIKRFYRFSILIFYKIGENMDINILVAQHKKSYIVDSNILKPITCGVYKESNKLSDGTGDNISQLNNKYCELTAQYWAWKNLKSDYYGFFHYRRFLSFNENSKLISYTYPCMDEHFINETCLSDEIIKKIVVNYDIIVPAPIKLEENSIYSQYKSSINHNIKDLDEILKILLKKFPEYKKSVNYVKKSKNFYSGNIYIMKKELFFNYCSWLFPLLEEFDKNHNYENCNIFSLRVIGFLAERLFNIYFHFLKKKNKELKIKTLPLCKIEDTSTPYPNKIKNSIPVVLTCDTKFAKYAGLIIEEIMINNKSNYLYEIFIMSNGISQFWCEKLKYMCKKYKNLCLTITNGARWLTNRKLNEVNHVNKTTFLRLCILDYLRNYDKVIYLDCDLLINDDLSKLYNINLSNFALGACLDTGRLSHFATSQTALYVLEEYKIKNPWNYFNAGVLLMNIKKMNEISSTNYLISLCEKNKYIWQDQDALNFTYQGYVKIIDNKWNCFSHDMHINEEFPEKNAPKKIYLKFLEACNNPSIIHYTARTMPNLCGSSSLSNYFWKYAKQSEFYYEILRDMTDIDMLPKKKKSNKFKTKIINFIKKNKFLYNFCVFVYRISLRK